MRRKFSVLLHFTVLAIWGAGCISNALTLTSEPPTESPYDLAGLIDDLRATGAQIEREESTQSDYFSVPRHEITIDGITLMVFEYADSAAAEAEAARVSPNGYNLPVPNPVKPNSPTEVHLDWSDSPHFFQRDRLIVQYIGRDVRMLITLKRLLGPQFAGDSTPVPPSDELLGLLDELRITGVIVELGEPFEPHEFAASGFTAKINGALVTFMEFADSASAATETAYVSPGGDGMTRPDPDNPQATIAVSWEPVDTPHWFKSERFVANYPGDSLTIINALEMVFGPQFAGGPIQEIGSLPSHFNLTWTLPAPRENWVGDVRLPPAWLGTGADDAVPASYGSFEIHNKGEGTVAHADGVPPQMMGDDLARVQMRPGEAATVIIFIDHGSIRSLRATLQPWSDELFFDPDAGRNLAGEGEHVGDFYSYQLTPFGEAGDHLLSIQVEFDNDLAGGHVTYLWQLHVGQADAAETELVPTPAPFPGDFTLVLSAEPLTGSAPLTVQFEAILTGGPDNSYELYCASEYWELGDGHGLGLAHACEEWTPAARLPRNYSLEHQYQSPGTYEVSFRLGDHHTLVSNGVSITVR